MCEIVSHVKCLTKNVIQPCFIILSQSYLPHNKKCLVSIMNESLIPDEHGLITSCLRECSSKISGISINIRSGPAEVNFQPIPACGGSISVSGTVCWAIIKGNGQHTIDKNRLSRQNCVRRPRANLTLSSLLSRGGLYRRK